MSADQGQVQPRIPFLLWGDLRRGGTPVLRRKLVGWRAHECMYAWVYLTDYLAVRHIAEIWNQVYKGSSADPFFPTLSEDIWARYERGAIDPHFQVNSHSFETAAICAAVLSTQVDRKATISELGSTFFTSIDKLRLAVAELSRLDPAVGAIVPAWCGIDNSSFVNEVARILHPGDVDLRLLDDYGKVRKSGGYDFFTSRFVCSYAFRRTSDLASFLSANYDGGIIEDAFAANGGEIELFNHGQRQTYLDIAVLCRKLQSVGRKVFLLDHFPDFPGETVRCFVCKLVFFDSQVDIDAVTRRVNRLGFNFSPDTQSVDAETVLDRLGKSVSEARWEEVRRYKMKEPVWGRTPVKVPKGPFIRQVMDSLYRTRQALVVRYQGWRSLNLRNPITTEDVDQALNDERSA